VRDAAKAAVVARPRGATPRAILLGLALIPLNCYLIVRLEKVLFGPYVSTISLFPNTITFLFFLVGANAILRRLTPRLALSGGEMMTLYTMLGISTGLAGLDGVTIIQEMIPYGAWYSGPPKSYEPLLRLFPPWLVVRDRSALLGYFYGDSSLYERAHLLAWAVPALAWTLFFTLFFWTLMCVNVLLRAQWQERERLTFPIVWLPLEMTAEDTDARAHPSSRFWRNPLLYLGFAPAFGLTLVNGLAFLLPAFPKLPIGETDLRPLMTTKPWIGIDWFPITFYPFVVGLGYLLPLDLLFSCWFGFLVFKAQMVVGNAMAWDTKPGFPYTKEQGFGMVVCLAGYILWVARGHLAEVWQKAWAGASTAPSTEAISSRTALLGLVGGVIALSAFLMAGGAQWWVALLALVLLLTVALVVARIRAEFGPPVHDFHFIGPDEMLPRLLGTAVFGPGDLTMLSTLLTVGRAHRGDPMPVGLEGLYLAHRRGFRPGPMFWACVLAAATSALGTIWAYSHQAYVFGVGSKFASHGGYGEQVYSRLGDWVNKSRDVHGDLMALSAILVGFAACAALLALRARFFGWPLHPIGIAVATSWSIHLIWMPLLIAWLIKWIVLRFGGLPLYRRFLPFFYGLILGDCVMGTLWSLISVVFNMETYSFFGG
jgi:hypothetical protein